MIKSHMKIPVQFFTGYHEQNFVDIIQFTTWCVPNLPFIKHAKSFGPEINAHNITLWSLLNSRGSDYKCLHLS